MKKKYFKTRSFKEDIGSLGPPEGIIMQDPILYRVWRTNEDGRTYLIGETDSLVVAREWEEASPRNRVEVVMHEPKEEERTIEE